MQTKVDTIETGMNTRPTTLLIALQSLLGSQGMLTEKRDCARFTTGARYGCGQTLAVLRPESHEQVVDIVTLCVEAGQALILQGANTGLVAASTPDSSGRFMVLSLERLKKHLEIDAVNRSVVVDAGVTLQDLNAALAPYDLFFPIDLGANPTIGGMIAANTGGARLIKYGDVRQNLLGLRAVLMQATAPVLDLQCALRKNNTGPDLKQLFVGSSGAYGIITRAVLQVHYLPKQTACALVVPRDQAAVLELLKLFERDCAEFLTAFEGISGAALQAVLRHLPGVKNPFLPDALPDYCVLLELTSTADQQTTGIDLEYVLLSYLEKLLGDVLENVVLGRAKEFWRIRHAISEALRHEGKIIAFDISMPRSSLVAFRAEAQACLARDYPWIKLIDFGHWADGGCHFNMVWPDASDDVPRYDADVVQQLRTEIYDLVVNRYQGSFSAEHGVGPYNINFYQRYTHPAAQRLAGELQHLLDPQRQLGLTQFGPVN